MNELRRKIVLSSPFLTAGLLTGCGGGGGDEPSSSAKSSSVGGMASAQAVGSSTGQTLLVSALTGTTLDTIWSSSYGGTFLVPTLPSPAIQTALNGTALSISVAEKFVVSASVTVYRTLSLILDNSAAPVLSSVYSVNQIKKGFLRVLKRTTSGSTITETECRYVLNTNTSSNTGTVKVGSVGGSRQVSYDGGWRQTSVKAYGLNFTNLKFNAVTGATSGSSAVNGLQLSGTSTLDVLPQETVAWL